MMYSLVVSSMTKGVAFTKGDNFLINPNKHANHYFPLIRFSFFIHAGLKPNVPA